MKFLILNKFQSIYLLFIRNILPNIDYNTPLEEIKEKSSELKDIPPNLILKALDEIAHEETDSILVFTEYEKKEENESNILDNIRSKRINQWDSFITNVSMNNETKKIKKQIDVLKESYNITQSSIQNNNFTEYLNNELICHKIKTLHDIYENLEHKKKMLIDDQEALNGKIENISQYEETVSNNSNIIKDFMENNQQLYKQINFTYKKSINQCKQIKDSQLKVYIIIIVSIICIIIFIY